MSDQAKVDATIKKSLKYNPDTGIFRWKRTRSSNALAGKVAGGDHGNGYKSVSFCGKRYYQHKLAWFFVYGEWPDFVDHINGDKTDNRIKNLRKTTVRRNALNTQKHRSGKKVGVYYLRGNRKKPYYSRIRVGTKQLFLGTFETEDEAHTAYLSALNSIEENHERKRKA